MQKKLGDYVKGLVEKREVLVEYYEPEALMVRGGTCTCTCT